jgi:hypothetical protein
MIAPAGDFSPPSQASTKVRFGFSNSGSNRNSSSSFSTVTARFIARRLLLVRERAN